MILEEWVPGVWRNYWDGEGWRGIFRALALGGGQRYPLQPGFELQVWQSIVAPSGTPAGTITRVSGAVAEAVMQPYVVKRLADTGRHAVGSTPAETGVVMRQDRER